MEKVLPILKYIFFNFDYFLIFSILFIWFFVKKWPNFYISKKITNIGQNIYNLFIKLAETKPFKLLIIFFILNFVVRIIMAFFVPDISLDKIAYHYLDLAKSLYEGKGFTIYVIWNNFLQDPKIIRPDFFRVPFYPFLIFIFYKLFNTSYFSAQLVNVIAGSLFPIIAYSFAYVLTKSKKIATLLLIFISFNKLILSWVTISYPEIVYGCCAILLLYFLYKSNEKKYLYSILVGIFWALAYLTRAEGLYVFLPVILFHYFYKQNKKQFLIKTALTFFGFLIIASPYLARNYVLTRNPFYSEFDKILMVEYIGRDYLIESPTVEYKNIYDLAAHNPTRTLELAFQKIYDGLISIPSLLIGGYAITILSLIGLIYIWREKRQKYYSIFLALSIGFILPIVAAEFTDRYFIYLIVLFYLFTCLGIAKLYKYNLKNNPIGRSLLAIYLIIFIIFNGLIGIGQGTLPLIPHSFYKRFDADKYFNGLKEFYDYIKYNTGKDDVIMASRRPYEVYYFTDRPTVIFPFATAQEIQDFIKKYQVKWVMWAGQPDKINGKYYRFWLPDEIPNNIKPAFENPGSTLFKVEY